MYRHPRKQERLVRSTGKTSTFGSVGNMQNRKSSIRNILTNNDGNICRYSINKNSITPKGRLSGGFHEDTKTLNHFRHAGKLLVAQLRWSKIHSESNLKKRSIPPSAPQEKGVRDWWQPLFLWGVGILTNPIEKWTERIDIVSSSEVDLRLQRLTFS